MGIEAIDHWVLVVKDLEATFAFYRKLGLEAGWQERPGGRGTRPIIRISETQKLNLYVVDRYEIERVPPSPLGTQRDRRTSACGGKNRARGAGLSSSRPEPGAPRACRPLRRPGSRRPVCTCVTPTTT